MVVVMHNSHHITLRYNMKRGIVLCNGCSTKFSVNIHKQEKSGSYITSLPNCKHHEWSKKKTSIHNKKKRGTK